MTTQKYIRKLAIDSVPAQPHHARLSLRYTAERAEKHRGQDLTDGLRESFDELVRLSQRSFLGAEDLAVSVTSPASDVVEVRLNAKVLPSDVIVVALRILVASNDSSPEDFQRLLYALDNDREAALQVYGGVDFETDVSGVQVRVEGNGPEQPFNPFYLQGAPGPILQAARLKVPGWATYMPDEVTENAILVLSGSRAFMPLGVKANYEPGKEDYFPSGDDLILSRISIEAASLYAVLACLGSQPHPALIEE